MRSDANTGGAVLKRGLYAITDCERLSPAELLARTVRILKAGIVALQYRNKVDTYPARREQAVALQHTARQFASPFIINDDIDLAKDIDADGVHLGSDDASCAEARARLGAKALIGISCYDSVERAIEARRTGADYVAFGAFFPTTTKKPRTAASLELLRRARRVLDIPIVAIGGIRPGNAAPLIEAGADVLAAASALYGAPDPARVVGEFNALFARQPAALSHAR